MPKIPTSDFDKKLGKRIQLRRKELGQTTMIFSENIGISQQQLSRYERGQNKITPTHLFSIAHYTKTPISWFFLDCQPEIGVGQVMEDSAHYNKTADQELATRLQQIWQTLSLDQKYALINFLDALH